MEIEAKMRYLSGTNLHQIDLSGFIASRTKNGLFTHTAIIVGKDSQGIVWLIENDNPSGVRWTTLHAFASGQEIKVTRSNLHPNLTVQRAISQLGKSYSLFSYNCQHFTNWAANGEASSPDIRNWTFIGIVIASGLIASNSEHS
ncbi:lecithin retinol acyltransferase family protein [Leptospira wolffii]|uniref:lecithin retinol acyltransferase family protein n=1 Tax=Leptospira wolffii TaxID=409998 RepID=UPI00068DE44B|nr:lecithin retinol acyltransferase family protein [Leptospira wolffii]